MEKYIKKDGFAVDADLNMEDKMKKELTIFVVALLSLSFVVSATTMDEEVFEITEGDLNNDGVLDCDDIEIFKGLLEGGGTPSQRKIADRNSDGKVNFLDTFWYLHQIAPEGCPAEPTHHTAVYIGGGSNKHHKCEGEFTFEKKYDNCDDWKVSKGREWNWLKGEWKDFVFLQTPNHKIFMKEGHIRVLERDGYRFFLSDLNKESATIEAREL